MSNRIKYRSSGFFGYKGIRDETYAIAIDISARKNPSYIKKSVRETKEVYKSCTKDFRYQFVSM